MKKILLTLILAAGMQAASAQAGITLDAGNCGDILALYLVNHMSEMKAYSKTDIENFSAAYFSEQAKAKGYTSYVETQTFIAIASQEATRALNIAQGD
jgi:hypothetical protein